MWQKYLERYVWFGHQVAFPRQLAFGVYFLRLGGDEREAARRVERWRTLPEGTIGRELVRFLDAGGLTLVPRYERHDLKHAILGYSQSPADEMRMQAFMTGNAGWRLESWLALLFLPWTPDAWADLPRHHWTGRNTRRISGLDLEQAVRWNLHEYRQQIGLDAARAAADVRFGRGAA